MAVNKVSAEINDTFLVKNNFGDFEWIADVPEDMGGTDLGPSPSQLLLSSIAGCKLMTMQMYAKRKSWQVEKIEIDLEYETLEDKTVFYQDITIQSDLGEKETERLLRIAERCPIARLVKGEVEFQEKTISNFLK